MIKIGMYNAAACHRMSISPTVKKKKKKIKCHSLHISQNFTYNVSEF